jgi:hypothetical protein
MQMRVRPNDNKKRGHVTCPISQVQGYKVAIMDEAEDLGQLVCFTLILH